MNPELLEIYVQTKLLTLLGEELPRQGILAGQGLAAIVLSCLWGRELPVEGLELYKDWPDEPLEEQGTIHYSRPSLEEGSYQIVSQNGFSILTSGTKGRLTTHIIQRCQANFGSERAMALLYSLDLNAFGVGYDCYGKKIYFTDDFVTFSRSRQLRIQSPVSAESLLSLLKFQHICDCYIDLEEEVSQLVGYRKICDQQGILGVYDDCVSACGKRIYDDYRLLLEPFCALLEFEQPVLPGLEVPMEMQYQIVFKNDPDSAGYANLINLFIHNNHACYDSYVFALLHNLALRKSSSKAVKRRLIIAMSYATTTCMVLLNPECLQHDFSEKHIQVIEQFRTLHPFCVNTLLSLGLSIIEMYKAIRLIRAYTKKNGNQIIGLIETHKRIGYKLEEVSRASLEQLLETYRTTAGVALVENQVDLSSFEYRESVVELTTTTELEIEGWKMNNCIGGYAAALKSDSGRTRIFHIDGLSPSTLAIYYEEDHKNVNFEVYGHSNRDALPEHLIVAERLGNYLLNVLWNQNETNNMLHMNNADSA